MILSLSDFDISMLCFSIERDIAALEGRSDATLIVIENRRLLAELQATLRLRKQPTHLIQ